MNVKPEAVVKLPAEVVTTTSTAPADTAGVVTVMDVSEEAVTAPAIPPKVTEEGDASFQPPSVTEVPPAVEPVVGETLETCKSETPEACSIPAPQVLVEQSRPVPVGNFLAVAVNRARMFAGVSVLSEDLSRAATPATCGAAMLVPLREATPGPPEPETGSVVPVFTVE